MKRTYFTLTGTNHYHGQEFLKPGLTVHLVKEPDNRYDSEAIKIELEGLGQIGYVANSPYTTLGNSYSAGRLYDKIGDTADGIILYVVPSGVLCYMEHSESGQDEAGDKS